MAGAVAGFPRASAVGSWLFGRSRRAELLAMFPSTGPWRSHSSRAASLPYTAEASMKESTVLICSRGLKTLVPEPGAAGVRVNDSVPRSFRKLSSGSAGSNGSGRLSPPAVARSPNVWSMNWPHTNPHCVVPVSEKRFWLVSLKMRLLR
jgi:hypothetical protein